MAWSLRIDTGMAGGATRKGDPPAGKVKRLKTRFSSLCPSVSAEVISCHAHASKFAETKDCARIVALNAGVTLSENSSKLGWRSESLNPPFEDGVIHTELPFLVHLLQWPARLPAVEVDRARVHYGYE
jgi:hypothetical protein